MARRAKEESPQENDFGTVEARRRAFHVVEQPDPQDRQTRRLRVEQDMVDWYLRRSYVTQIQADALRKWQSDAYLAGLMPACIAQYERRIPSGLDDLSDIRLAAQARRDNAIAFLTVFGPNAVGMVEAVAVEGKSAGRWLMERTGGSPHEAMLLLARYTDGLSRHYGLAR
jgi:hypothetical protein